jgi:four helix bundle protein
MPDEEERVSDNLIVDKSYRFSLKIIELYRFLTEEKREYILSKQLLRCGTSIGANIHEAQAAVSKRDFVSKISIASKEARETFYWLRLMRDSGFIDEETALGKELFNEIESMMKITTKIVKTGQENASNR